VSATTGIGKLPVLDTTTGADQADVPPSFGLFGNVSEGSIATLLELKGVSQWAQRTAVAALPEWHCGHSMIRGNYEGFGSEY
jgi:hypothetical protein